MSEEPELVPAEEPDGELVAVPEPATAPEAAPMAETAAEIAELDVDAPRVAIVVAEPDDLGILGAAETALSERGVRSETRVLSADEEPEAIAAYAENARLRGIRVVLAGAGPAARLPSMVTVHTRLPVIGVPLSTQGARAGELDGLLEPGDAGEEPVAWVGLDDALGAAVVAARILGA